MQPTIEWGGYLEAIQSCEKDPTWEKIIEHDNIFIKLQQIEESIEANNIDQFLENVDSVSEVELNKLNSKVLDILRFRTVQPKFPKESFEAYKILYKIYSQSPFYTSFRALQKYAELGLFDIVKFIIKNSKGFTTSELEVVITGAIRHKFTEIAIYLIKETPLLWFNLTGILVTAMQYNNIEMLGVLNKKGAKFLHITNSICDVKPETFIFLMENFQELQEKTNMFMLYFIHMDNDLGFAYLVNKHNVPFSLDFVIEANANNILTYLIKNNKLDFELTEKHCVHAIKNEAFKCLKTLWKQIPSRDESIIAIAEKFKTGNTAFIHNLMLSKMLTKEQILFLIDNAVETKNYKIITFFLDFYIKNMDKDTDKLAIREFFSKIIN